LRKPLSHLLLFFFFLLNSRSRQEETKGFRRGQPPSSPSSLPSPSFFFSFFFFRVSAASSRNLKPVGGQKKSTFPLLFFFSFFFIPLSCQVQGTPLLLHMTIGRRRKVPSFSLPFFFFPPSTSDMRQAAGYRGKMVETSPIFPTSSPSVPRCARPKITMACRFFVFLFPYLASPIDV